MINLTLYYRKNSILCDKAINDLEEIKNEIPLNLLLIDIDTDKTLYKKMENEVPIIEVGPYRLEKEFDKQRLLITIRAALERKDQLEKTGEPDYQQRVQQGRKITGTDRFSYWFSKHYMVAFNFLVLLYVGLPFFAPVLMKINAPQPARVIYTIYSPLCHQLAFRSFFLFGEQNIYPRSLAQIPDVITYEQITGNQQINLLDARSFIGNEKAGFKVAICERDAGIYGSILLFGIIFALTGKRFKSFPWYIWIIVGLVPIGLDGGSQLPSLAGNIFPAWLPIRESTPFLRVITGSLFGFTTAWYLYPLIEETMQDTRRVLQKKLALQQSITKENQSLK